MGRNSDAPSRKRSRTTGSGWRQCAALIATVAAVLMAALPASAPATEAGVQAHLLWSGVSASEVREQLNEARVAGARYVRVDVGWSTLMPDRRGKLDRSYLRRIDRVVRMANRRRLELILTFWTTP